MVNKQVSFIIILITSSCISIASQDTIKKKSQAPQNVKAASKDIPQTAGTASQTTEKNQKTSISPKIANIPKETVAKDLATTGTKTPQATVNTTMQAPISQVQQPNATALSPKTTQPLITPPPRTTISPSQANAPTTQLPLTGIKQKNVAGSTQQQDTSIPEKSFDETLSSGFDQSATAVEKPTSKPQDIPGTLNDEATTVTQETTTIPTQSPQDPASDEATPRPGIVTPPGGTQVPATALDAAQPDPATSDAQSPNDQEIPPDDTQPLLGDQPPEDIQTQIASPEEDSEAEQVLEGTEPSADEQAPPETVPSIEETPSSTQEEIPNETELAEREIKEPIPEQPKRPILDDVPPVQEYIPYEGDILFLDTSMIL